MVGLTIANTECWLNDDGLICDFIIITTCGRRFSIESINDGSLTVGEEID